jgi:hypothetical protein
MNTHQEAAQITADKMINRAKESGVDTMGIEYRENGRVTSGVLRCAFKYSVGKSRIRWVLTNAQYLAATPKSLTKTEAIALIADHYDMTCDAPAPAAPVAEPAKEAPAFRTIEELKKPGASSVWVGYRAGVIVAKFWVESDAIEWRAADPLNKGTIGELAEREEHRKLHTQQHSPRPYQQPVIDYVNFMIATSAKLNAMTKPLPMKKAYAFLSKECSAHGYNRAAMSVRRKGNKFEVYALGGR